MPRVRDHRLGHAGAQRSGLVPPDPRDDASVFRVDHMPVILLERRDVEIRAVGRHRHPIAPAVIFLFPKDLVGAQIDAGERTNRAHIDPLREPVGADPLHILGFARLRGEPRGLDPFHELVAMIDVKDQNAVTTVFQVVANTRLGDIQPSGNLGVFGPNHGNGGDGEEKPQASCDHRRVSAQSCRGTIGKGCRPSPSIVT